jgi:hypothetical protein
MAKNRLISAQKSILKSHDLTQSLNNLFNPFAPFFFAAIGAGSKQFYIYRRPMTD